MRFHDIIPALSDELFLKWKSLGKGTASIKKLASRSSGKDFGKSIHFISPNFPRSIT